VRQGLPFRQAHSVAGQAVRLAIQQGKALDALSLEEYQSLSPAIGPDVFAVFDPRQSIARRNVMGGTAPEAVTAQLQQAKALLYAD